MPESGASDANKNVRYVTIEIDAKFTDLVKLPSSDPVTKKVGENFSVKAVNFSRKEEPGIDFDTETSFAEFASKPMPDKEGVYQIRAVAPDGHAEITFHLTDKDSKPENFVSAIEAMALLQGRGRERMALSFKFTKGDIDDQIAFRKVFLEKSFQEETEALNEEVAIEEDPEDEQNFVIGFLKGAAEKIGAALRAIKDKFVAFFMGIKNYLFPAKVQAPPVVPVPPPRPSASTFCAVRAIECYERGV